MSIKVESTTDSKEVVAAVMAEVNPKPEVEATPPAAEEIQPEPEASGALDEIDTDEDDQDAGEPGTETPRKAKGAVKRIGKLTKQREDARREAAYWKEEALKQRPTESKPVATEVVEAKGKPTADAYETHEGYVEALADWKVEQKLSARDATNKQNELKAEQDTKLKGYIQKRDDFAKGHDDYFERMEDIGAIPMSITVNEALLESENGPELLYELAKDPEEYKRICALPAIAAARELGKFEAKLAKDPEPQTAETKTSKAPTPIRPVGVKTTGSGKKTIFSADLTQSEYEALRREQIAKKA